MTIKTPKAQILQAKYVLCEDDTEFSGCYEDTRDEFMYCFFGDLEIDGNLRLGLERYGDAKNYAGGFCKRYDIRNRKLQHH